MSDHEIIEFLKKHLRSIQENDTKTYNETTAEDLTLYEWYVTPHRIDGIPFHEFMMKSNAARGSPANRLIPLSQTEASRSKNGAR